MKKVFYSILVLLFSVSLASAGIVFDGSPGTNPAPPTLGGYTMTSFPLDGRPLGNVVTTVPSPLGGDILFSNSRYHVRINQGWNNWSNGYTGDVYYNYDTSPLLISLPIGTTAFYFYMEGDAYQTITMSATANDGTTSGPITVTTPWGAKYFGFYSNGGTQLISILINSAGGNFAVGEFGISKGATQDHDIVFSSIWPTQMNMSWTRENGDGSFVVVRDGSALTSSETPVNGTLYMSSNTNFSLAPSIGAGKICYMGTSNSIVLTGLTKLHRYYTQVFAYLGNPMAGTAIFTTSAATGNPKNQITSRFKHSLVENDNLTYSFDIGDIYPLPTKSEINFSLKMLRNDNLTFEIFNEVGNVIYRSEAGYGVGDYVYTIPVSQYTSGSYMLRVYSENDNIIVPFVIER